MPAFSPSRLILLRAKERLLKRAARPSTSPVSFSLSPSGGEKAGVRGWPFVAETASASNASAPMAKALAIFPSALMR